jgi:hypothetical protein
MKCPKCDKINYGVKKCENCFEPLEVKVAKWVKDLDGWKGDATLYHLDPPKVYSDIVSDDNWVETEYEWVVISSVFGMVGPETIILEGDEDGAIVDTDEHGNPIGIKALDKVIGDTDHKAILPDYEFRLRYPDRADYVE